MFGAAVCALALMGTVLGGFLLNVDATVDQETDYNYVTDVSGLFNYTDTPQYVVYNSSKNFTGYSLSDGSAVPGDEPDPANNVYYKTSQPNSYLMAVSNTDTTSTLNLNSAPYTSTSNQSAPRFGNSAIYYGQFIDGGAFNMWASTSPYILSLEKFYELYAPNIGANVTSVDFTFTGQVPPSAPSSSAGLSAMGLSSFDSSRNYFNKSYHDYNNSGILTYSLETGGWTFNNAPIAASNYFIVFSSTLNKYVINGSQATATGDTVSYPNVNITVTQHKTVYNYMDVSKGVRNANTDAGVNMIWSNGYTNGQIDLLYNLGTGQYDTLTFGSDTIELRNTGGRFHVSVNGSDNDLGVWRYAVIQLDTQAHEVRAIPVYSSNFRNFTDYRVSDYTYKCGTISATDITALTWTTAHSATAPLFTVVNTSVYMDTYGAVMLDPSLDITSWFTDLAHGYRLNLYSFAIYGSSITVNGETYPVTDGQITIDGEQNTLNNVYIQTADGHTYIVFVNSNAKYDLGETVSDIISMTGNWYFTTGFYEGYLKDVRAYHWDLDNFGFNTAQALVVFMILAVAGLFVGRSLFNIKPSYIDYLIIIGAVACVFGLCEVVL